MRLNYCRQFRKWAAKNIANKDVSSDLKKYYLNPMGNAVKFILPDGAKIIGDEALELLTDERHVHLPYPTTLLEYRAEGVGYDGTDATQSPRRIIIASEVADSIFVAGIWDMPEYNFWNISPWLRFDRPELGKIHTKEPSRFDVLSSGAVQAAASKHPKYLDSVREDMAGELFALGRFMSALACKNIGSAKVPTPSGSKRKAALRFDDYRCLVLANGENGGGGTPVGDRRSPREHLRRGHIRTMSNGHKTWINSTVISAGSGGVIKKSYEMKSTVK